MNGKLKVKTHNEKVKTEDGKNKPAEIMKIVTDTITRDELQQMAGNLFSNLVKAVVDIEREVMAVDAELHSDLEMELLQDGSLQKNLWGINLYPEMRGGEFVEFDSIINIRPSQGNRGRGVDDEDIRHQIMKIVAKRVAG